MYGNSHRPQPIPYQGSKRQLASRILETVNGKRFRRLYEPFAGSAAITLAAAGMRLAGEYRFSDSLEPLASIWQRVLVSPGILANTYESIWMGQIHDPIGHYNQIRSEFNNDSEPAKLLYLLARCAKNAPRFNQQGGFNQSADRRRKGMHPLKMRRELLGAAALLRGKASAQCCDFEEAINEATSEDLVYMDPPYEGTTTGPHKRYHRGLQRERLIAALKELNRRNVPFLLSYDGRCGEKIYGAPLPESLGTVRIELEAGRSTQSTLLGRAEMTVESLYVSQQLAVSLNTPCRPVQLSLLTWPTTNVVRGSSSEYPLQSR